VNTTNASSGLPEDTPLVEPVTPPEAPTDPEGLDTQRILRETGSLSLPGETASPPASSPHTSQVPPSDKVPAADANTGALNTVGGSWSLLAIAAFVLGLALSPLAALFGYVALGSLRRSGQHGEQLAVTAIVLGWLWTLIFGVVGIVVGIIWFQL